MPDHPLGLTALVAAGGQHGLRLLSGGHHGLRLVALVVLLAAVAAGPLVLFRRLRARRGPGTTTVLTAIPTPSDATTVEAAQPPRALVPSGGPGTVAGVKARGLTKRYGAKLAVDSLSFAVGPGHVTGFLGPNGAGKSTTMRMIIGLDAPDTGSVTINGSPYHDLECPLREVGALLKASAVHPGRSAYAHLWVLARTNGIPRGRVDEVLDFVGLTSVARQRAGQFSLGMGQRLGIAAALLGDPGVLLLDEPMNGLDTEGIRWVRNLMRRLAAEGRTVFVSSHLMSEMALMADQVVVIGRGRLIAEMPVEEFTAQNSRSYVRVRSPHMELLRPALEQAGASVQVVDGAISVRGMSEDQVGELAWEHSVMLYELAPQSASLEEAFVESTGGDTEYRGEGPRPVGGPKPDEGATAIEGRAP